MAESYAGYKVRAKWDFNATRDDELNLEEDDIIILTQTPDGDWWEGECKGSVGWFPCSYIEWVEEGEEEEEAYQAPTDVDTGAAMGADENDPAAISSEQNRAWYKNYKSKQISPFKMKEEVPEPSTPSQTSVDSTPRVVMMPAAAARPKWSDNIDGAILGRLSEKEKKRQEVIYELIQTERDYVRDLETIIEVYLVPLRTKKILPPKDLTVLFSNVEMLVPVNLELLRTLEERRETYPILEHVGDVFLRIADYLKIYNMYCSNHPYALMKYESCKSKAFRNYENEAKARPECRQLDLCSFLIKPVQRICKYPLLIREILKFTDENHPDRADLDEAFLKIETVVTIVNEATRRAEAVQKMLDMQERFNQKVQLLAPSRRFMREETIGLVDDGKRTDLDRKLFLFNDLMIIAKPKGDKLKLIALMPLDVVTVEDGEGETFDVFHAAHQKYTIVCKSIEAKAPLFQDITELAQEELERREFERQFESEEEEEPDLDAPLPPLPPQEEDKPRVSKALISGPRVSADEERRLLAKAEGGSGSPNASRASMAATKGPAPPPPKGSPAAAAAAAPSTPTTGKPSHSASSSTSSVAIQSSSRPASTASSSRASTALPSTVVAQQQRAEREREEFANVRSNLRKTVYHEDVASSPSSSAASSPVASSPSDLRSQLRSTGIVDPELQRRKPPPSSAPAGQSEPEFAKIKLRKTVYGEELVSASGSSGGSSGNSVNNAAAAESGKGGSKEEDKKKKKKKKEKGGEEEKKSKKSKESKGKDKAEAAAASTKEEKKEKKPGFFASLFGKKKKPAAEESPKATTTTSKTTSAAASPAASSPAKASPQRVSTASPAASSPAASSPQRTSTAQPSKPSTPIGARASTAGTKLLVTNVVVKDHRRTDGPKKDYVYVLEVTREDGYVYTITKSYEDFYAFHSALVYQFPEEAGRINGKRRILPDLPTQSMYTTDAQASQMRREFGFYMRGLMRLPDKISKSAFLNNFLREKDSSSSSSGAAGGAAGGRNAQRYKPLPAPSVQRRDTPAAPSASSSSSSSTAAMASRFGGGVASASSSSAAGRPVGSGAAGAPRQTGHYGRPAPPRPSAPPARGGAHRAAPVYSTGPPVPPGAAGYRGSTASSTSSSTSSQTRPVTIGRR